MPRKTGQRSNSSGESATVNRRAVAKATGKATEKDVAFTLREAYGSAVDIIRLPDKYDTGRFEDKRPSDFLVVLSHNLPVVKAGGSNTYYIEAKETAADKKTWAFSSVFQKGQLQAMMRASINKNPYFVVFQYLQTRKLYLVPSSAILNIYLKDGKSISKEIIESYEWTDGKLYNYFLNQPKVGNLLP